MLLDPLWLKVSASAPGILPGMGVEKLRYSQISPLSIHSFPIKSLSLLSLLISVSTVPLKSGIKLLTCSNSEQWCPLMASAGSIYAHHYVAAIL